MGAMQRRKGHRFENRVASWFRDRFGVDAARGLQNRGGGAEESDVEVFAPGGERLPLHVECKHGKAPSVWEKLRQAHEDRAEGELAVVVVKRDREEPCVFMSLEDFEPFMQAWLRQRSRIRRTPLVAGGVDGEEG